MSVKSHIKQTDTHRQKDRHKDTRTSHKGRNAVGTALDSQLQVQFPRYPGTAFPVRRVGDYLGLPLLHSFARLKVLKRDVSHEDRWGASHRIASAWTLTEYEELHTVRNTHQNP